MVEMMWRLVGRSATPIVCGVYRTAAGLKVISHYADSTDALIRGERVADMDVAYDVAAVWKQAALELGLTEIR